MRRSAVLPIWLGLSIGTSSCILAQASPDSTVRLSCAEAVRSARGEASVAPRERGIDVLGNCPREFAQVVPALWRGEALPTGVMNALVRQSRGVRDSRVFNALIATVQDGSAPVNTRLTALTVLAAYLEPFNGVRVRDLLNGSIGEPMPIVNHTSSRDGEMPVGADELQKAVVLFSELAANGSPVEIKRAGRYLRRGFITRFAAMTPLPVGAVVGTWDCQGRLALENVSDTDLPLSLLDAGGVKFQELMLHAPGSTPWPSKWSVQLSKTGPITVQFGGRTLLNLGCQ